MIIYHVVTSGPMVENPQQSTRQAENWMFGEILLSLMVQKSG